MYNQKEIDKIRYNSIPEQKLLIGSKWVKAKKGKIQNEFITARHQGETSLVSVGMISLMDVSPKQVLSVAILHYPCRFT